MAMGTKAVIAAITISLFLISLVGMQDAKVAMANPIPWFPNPQMTVTVQSPVNGSSFALPVFVNFTAQGDLQFSVSDNITQQWVRSFFYVLDGQNMQNSALRFAGTKTTEIQGDPVYKYNFSGQAYLTNLSDGPHSITVYYGAVNSIGYVGTPNENIYYNPKWQATAQFYVDSTITPSPTLAPAPAHTPSPSPTSSPSPSPTPTANPTLTASLSESASALNFGNRVNFTVTAEGGKEPYTYAWHLDNQLAETSTSPYFATDNQTVGSHHVYVEVNDADNNSANTLTVEFNVLPTSSSPSPSPPQTQQSTPTLEPSPMANTQNNSMSILTIATLVVAVIVVASLVYFMKRKGRI